MTPFVSAVLVRSANNESARTSTAKNKRAESRRCPFLAIGGEAEPDKRKPK